MIFEIEFEYTARYRRVRGRKDRTASVLGSVEVEIEVVAEPGEPKFTVDQPVRSHSMWRPPWQRFHCIGNRPGRVWQVGETLFAEDCAIEEFIDRIRRPDRNPFDAFDHGKSANPFGPSGSWHSRFDTYEEIAATGLLTLWDETDGVAKGDLIARRARAFRVIDGMICVAVDEPLVCVEVQIDRVVVTAQESVPDQRDNLLVPAEASDGRFYRLENLEQAKAFAAKTALATGKRLYSDLVCTGTSSAYLAQAGQHVDSSLRALTSLFTDNQKHFESAAVEAWGRLHSYLYDFPRDHTAAELVSLAEVFLQELSSATAVGEVRNFGELVSRACEDIRSWHERPNDTADWSADALPDLRNYTGCRLMPILSPRALKQVSLDLSIPFDRLLGLHDQGHRLFVHELYEKTFVVVAPDFTASEALGPYGVARSVDDLVGLQEFLTKHLEREFDLVSLGEILLPDIGSNADA